MASVLRDLHIRVVSFHHRLVMEQLLNTPLQNTVFLLKRIGLLPLLILHPCQQQLWSLVDHSGGSHDDPSGALTPPMNTNGDSQASSLTVFFNVLWWSPPNAEHRLSGSALSCLLSDLFNSLSSVPPGSSDPIGCYRYPFWTTQDGKPVYTLEIRWRSRILWISWNFRKNWCVCVYVCVCVCV